jgi:glucokinase
MNDLILDGPAEFVVAVDLGGTLTKIAYADHDGQLSTVQRIPTQRSGGSVSVEWLAETLTRRAHARSDARCRGYAVVAPGIIDAAAGVVRMAPNVGWRDVPLRARLDELTGLIGVVGHDVRTAGLAEWRVSRPDAANLLFLALGTGVAGAMVVDGRMLEAGGFAGEIGHLRVAAAADQLCACGQIGCLETVASAAGIARTYARVTASPVPALPQSRALADLARAGDSSALEAFRIATDALAEALVAYVTLLAPELIIIGGGLAGAADMFLPGVVAAVRERLAFQGMPAITTADLGPDAGVIGAGLIGWDQVRALASGQVTSARAGQP